MENLNDDQLNKYQVTIHFDMDDDFMSFVPPHRLYIDDLINKGIRTFEEFYQKRSEKLIAGKKTATQLSNALAKSLGQRGKKVQELYYPEPIPKWIKRREMVEKKLGN